MGAHLLKGRYKNSRILQEDTVRLMHDASPTILNCLGTAYSFHGVWKTTFERSGTWQFAGMILTLLPDQNIGIFTATNSFGAWKTTNSVFNRYFQSQQICTFKTCPPMSN